MSEFQSHITATHNDEVLGNFLQFQHGFIGQYRNIFKTFRNSWSCSNIDIDGFSRKYFSVYFYALWINKLCLSSYEADVRFFRKAFFPAVSGLLDYFVLSSFDLFQVHLDLPFNTNTQFLTVSGDKSSSGAGNICFGGSAAGIYTGAAKMAFLYNSNFFAFFGKAESQWWARLACSNNYGIVIHVCLILLIMLPVQHFA